MDFGVLRCVVEACRAAATQPFDGKYQASVVELECHDRVEHGDDALCGRSFRTQRRASGSDGLAGASKSFVIYRTQQYPSVSESPEERALSDARGAGDVLPPHV